jgi:hypothetical protein
MAMSATVARLTDEEVNRIEDEAKAITQGPWMWEANTTSKQLILRNARHDTVLDFVRWGMHGTQPRLNVDGIMCEMLPLMNTPQPHNAWRKTGVAHPDARFIETAPIDVPALVRDLKAARATLKELADDLHILQRSSIPEMAEAAFHMEEKVRTVLPPE